jgi:hypothetical protein
VPSDSKGINPNITVDTTPTVIVQNKSRPEVPSWLVKCFDWVPLRWFLFIGGILLTLLSIIDLMKYGNNPKGMNNFIFVFVFIAGIVVMSIEGPLTFLTRRFQLGIYFWFRLLSRLWGRAWFYLFVAILCFAQSPFVTATSFAGFYLICWVPLMFVISRRAALKYQRMYIYTSGGAEGKERLQKFAEKFDDLDITKSGFITSTNLSLLAIQSGRSLSNAERHAIYSFLDVSCNGKISKEDFIKQFRDHNVKQRFL